LLETRVVPANVDVVSNHYDNLLSGDNSHETILTPANINATNFGKLFDYALDGYAYAQPLYKANLSIGGVTHNVVFAATEHDSVYAYDADGGGLLWKRSFLDTANGITSVPQPDVISGDIVPEIGITGTPVIDGGANTMYVVVKTKEMVAGTAHYVQRLHALDITTGQDRPNGVVTIGDTTLGGPDGGYTDNTNISVPGTGAGSDGTTLRFNALRENQRTALALVNGVVYVSFASHGDNGPYHGWVIGYNASNIASGPAPGKVFNTAPNGSAVGIWQSGGGLASDSQNNLYFATGNGFGTGFDPTVGSYSESVLKISTTGQLSVADYFTPFDWKNLDNNDADLGSGGTMLLPDAVSGGKHLVVETGKTGRMYLIDRDNMGKNTPGGPDKVLQTISIGGPGVWGNPSFFQDGTNTGLIYYWGTSNPGQAFRITNGVINATPVSTTQFAVGFPGAQPTISSNGTDGTSAIMWALRSDNYAQNGPEILYAFKAEDLSQLLYASDASSLRDQFGSSVKFTSPIVSNGHVFAGSNGHLAVYGFFQPAAAVPSAPSNLQGTPVAGGTQIQLTWTNPALGTNHDPTGIKILRSLDGVTYSVVAQVDRFTNSYTDSGLTPSTLYHYQVVATNQQGDSAPSNTLDIRTRMAAPVLKIDDICVGEASLRWTAVANDHYDIYRGDSNGANFTLIASVDASQTSFMDMGLANGTYTYHVTGFSVFTSGPLPNDSADSNVAKATLGPVTISHVDPTDPNGILAKPGFFDSSDMQANGSALFSTDEHLLRLTKDFGQAGSAFTLQKVADRQFTTTFDIRVHEGSQPNPADGLTFTLQGNNPGALGGGGGSLGYQGIGNSVAVMFKIWQNPGDPSASTTGLLINGQDPTGRGTDTNPSGVNLRSQTPKQITLSYDGTTLSERIEDLFSHAVFNASYTVDIASIIGGDTAYAGFTGGTGGAFALQDVLNWKYTEQEANLPPRAPTNLRVVSVDRHDHNRSNITIAWNCNNAYTAQGFIIEESPDGTHWTQIDQVDTSTMTDTFVKQGAGVYYYRVRSFNALGLSHPSNVTSLDIAGGDHPFDLNFATFNNHSFLTANGAAHFTPDPVAVGTFLGHQDIGNTAATGNATFDSASGTYTVNSSGFDIWDTHDAFQYVYKPLTGDGEIIARAVNVQPTDFWTKAGVMIRESLDSNSRNAFMLETAHGTPNGDNDQPIFHWRTDTTVTSGESGAGFGAQRAPVWLRLVRSGNSFTGFWAHDNGDGTHGSWNQTGGAITINMPTTVYVGLALTGQGGKSNTSTFDHVSIAGNTSAPLPPTVARLTDGDFGEAGTVFTKNQVAFNNFTTSFTYQENPRVGAADGLTFIMQADLRGANAVGGAGGGLGYTGIANSIAVKFDIWTSNTHRSTTGLYLDGEPVDSAAGRAKQIFMDTDPANVIDFNSGHVFQIDLAYDSSALVLTETVTDTVTHARFTQSYNVDIAAHLGSNVGYVGFGGGTGGQTAVQDILTWTYHSDAVGGKPGDSPGTPAAPFILGSDGGSSAGTPSTPTAADGGRAGAIMAGSVPGDGNAALLSNRLNSYAGLGSESSVGFARLAQAGSLLPNPATGIGADPAGFETLLGQLARYHLAEAQPTTNEGVLDQVFSTPDLSDVPDPLELF
jgi:hypothetical protein